MALSQIQLNWELSHTVFNSLKALSDLIKNCGKDDASGQAVLALEQLGASMLVRDSLIGDCYDLLRKQNYTFLESLQVFVGLPGDGLVQELRKSTGCIACVLLIAGCRGSYSDLEIANLLFQAMAVRGVLRKVPTSPAQLAQVVHVTSGYCHALSPAGIFQELSAKVARFAANAVPARRKGFKQLGNHLDVAQVAEILVAIFNGIQDEEVPRITLSGSLNALWIASFLLWILPVEVAIYMDGELLQGTAPGRLEIYFDVEVNATWKIREWRAQTEIASIISTKSGTFDVLRERSLSSYPIGSTKDIMVMQSFLSNIEADYVGHLAASLIDIGKQAAALSPTSLSRSAMGQNTVRITKLADLYQRDFALAGGIILKRFGWIVDEAFLANRDMLKDLLEPWINFDLPHKTQADLEKRDNILQDAADHRSISALLRNILEESWFGQAIKHTTFRTVISYSVHLACDVLASSCCNKFSGSNELPTI